MVCEVCERFGIGRVVATRRLGHEYGLSEALQDQMLSRDHGARHDREHPDAAVVPGLRRGRLLVFVGEALRAGKIDAVEARSILRVRMSEALPEAIAGERGTPLVEEERLACVRAEAHMRAKGVAHVHASNARRTTRGWEVALVHGEDAKEERVLLSSSFERLAI